MKRKASGRVQELFLTAADLPAEARVEFLFRECGNDKELQREVRRLLELETNSSSTPSSGSVEPEKKSEKEPTKVLTDHPSIPPGTQVKRYRIISLIGKGGMGDVYLADDLSLDRKVALKVLNKNLAEDRERLHRFIQEAKAASSLNHPNIITVHEIDSFEGFKYIVSEYVEGKTLGEVIADREISIQKKLEIAKQVASALYEAHKVGIIHRDVKPENIIRRKDGLIKVLDFGLAKTKSPHNLSLVDSEGRTREQVLTSPGMVMGTPNYMSPEQAAGKDVDHKTDIFSFGVLLFELISGYLPFQGENAMTTIASILHEDPKQLGDYVKNLPVGLSEIVNKALIKDKDARYENMGGILDDLEAVLARLPVESEHPTITRGEEPRITAQNTVQIWLVGHLVWLLVPVFLIFAAIAAISIPYYFGFFSETVETETGQTMKTVAITSWTSGTGELSPNASFSPDSRLIAYSAARTGASQIWLKPVIGGKDIRVTNDNFFNQYPVWSPDGTEIAYYSQRGEDSGIWRISFTGGQPTLVAGDLEPGGMTRRWSENGKILFQEKSELYSVEVATGKREKLTAFEAGKELPRSIEISRDGQKIAITAKAGATWNLLVRDLESGAETVLDSSKSQIEDLAWHPDGERVVYSKSIDGIYQVFEMRMGDQAATQLSNGDFHHFVQDVAKDGVRILYRSATEQSDIWRVEIESGKESVLTEGTNAEYWGEVSPDNETVVYQSVPKMFAAFSGSILVNSLNSDGEPQELANSGSVPTWSHDGNRIAFLKRSGSGIELWGVGKTGTGAAKLTGAGVLPVEYLVSPYLKIGPDPMAWSPDDKYLAYGAFREGLTNIWMVSEDGKAETRITDNRIRNDIYSCPMWLGKEIVFSSMEAKDHPVGERIYKIWKTDPGSKIQDLLHESRRGVRILGTAEEGNRIFFAVRGEDAGSAPVARNAEIYALSVESLETTRILTIVDVYFHNIHLAPDLRSVAYVVRRADNTSIQTQPLEGGEPRTLAVEKDPKVFVSSLSWSPNGNSIVFGRQSSSNLLSMLVDSTRTEKL